MKPSVIAVLSTLLTVPALAQPILETGDGRFVLKETPDGFLRMDSRTGNMSLCSRSDGVFTCKMVADDRLALDAEIKRLNDENEALKKRSAQAAPSLPPDAEMDRAIGMMSRMLRLFRDVIREEQQQVPPKSL